MTWATLQFEDDSIVGRQEDFKDESHFLDWIFAEYDYLLEDVKKENVVIEKTYCRYCPGDQLSRIKGETDDFYMLTNESGAGAFPVYVVKPSYYCFEN